MNKALRKGISVIEKDILRMELALANGSVQKADEQNVYDKIKGLKAVVGLTKGICKCFPELFEEQEEGVK